MSERASTESQYMPGKRMTSFPHPSSRTFFLRKGENEGKYSSCLDMQVDMKTGREFTGESLPLKPAPDLVTLVSFFFQRRHLYQPAGKGCLTIGTPRF
jgi:hypothetical protein